MKNFGFRFRDGYDFKVQRLVLRKSGLSIAGQTSGLKLSEAFRRFTLRLLLLIAFLTILVSVFARQEKVSISRGFFTGRDYLEMTDTEKRAYATGAINGMLVAPFFGAPQERVEWLKNCSAKLSDEQTAAILTRYVTEQPEQDTSLNVLTFNAMRQACGK